MSKIRLTNAMKDSHRMTMGIHLSTAKRLIKDNDWRGAKISLEMAIPHANAIGHKESKSEIFGKLNTVRAKIKKQAALPNPFEGAEFAPN
jgi:hypothetical protein